MNKVFHIISNKEWGGGEQYVFDLGRRQLADGMEVELCCLPIDVVMNKFKELNVPMHIMPLRGIVDAFSAWQLAKLLRNEGEVTVHAHNFKDAFTAAYARKLSCNGKVRVIMSRHLTRKGKKKLPYKWLYHELDCLHFDSEIARNTFLSTNPGIDKRKTCVVHTSIVLPEMLTPINVRGRFAVRPETTLAMYHGRLDPEKGIDVLIRACTELRDLDFRLLIVGRGDDDYWDDVRQSIRINQLEEKVGFAGFQHPVLPFIAAADFGILPSVVREGCPLSPQEYMCQGHPVIATNNGGQREYMVDDYNGLLVEPGDSHQLAQAMRRLITDPQLLERLGRQAKADFFEKLSYEQFYKNIMKIYDYRR